MLMLVGTKTRPERDESRRSFYCNVYPDRVEQTELGVILRHGDCTELVPSAVLGPFIAGDELQKKRFQKEGILGVYRYDGVGVLVSDLDGKSQIYHLKGSAV